MKKRKGIWLAAGLFVIIESFAFPEILFPDCIGECTADKYLTYKNKRKETDMVKYHLRSFFLEYLNKLEK